MRPNRRYLPKGWGLSGDPGSSLSAAESIAPIAAFGLYQPVGIVSISPESVLLDNLRVGTCTHAEHAKQRIDRP